MIHKACIQIFEKYKKYLSKLCFYEMNAQQNVIERKLCARN